MSDPLLSEFRQAKHAFDKACAVGDSRLALEQANKCARVLRLLATDVPNQRKSYIASAAKWEETAKTIKSRGLQEPHKLEGGPKPPGPEFREYIEGLISTSEATWDDIGGLKETKRLLRETVVIATMNRPKVIKPWSGILLFGPPGTGKTLLAAAAAGSLKATFFNVSADKVLSKYYGESSRLIAALYEVALEKCPSIIFIDELDALTLSRSGDQHQASRQTLSTLLAQIQGFESRKSNDLVMTLAATNAPWDMDTAALGRFGRRIHVPLPDIEAAVEIMKINTRGLDVTQVPFESIAQNCYSRFFSGRDISYLCQQAVLNMIRGQNKDLEELSSLPFSKLKAMSLKTGPLKASDFHSAFERIKIPLTTKDLEKYASWSERYGG